MNTNMAIPLENRIEAAKEGRKKWLSLVEQYKIDNSRYVILLPGTERMYNAPALSYLAKFLGRRGIKRAFVFSFDPWVMVQKEKYCNIADIVFCGEKDMKNLIQFYCLYEFAPNIAIASLEEPPGRLGKGLIGKKGLSPEEVFAGIVYSIVE